MHCPRCCCLADHNYEMTETSPKLGIVCFECDYCQWQGFSVWDGAPESEDQPQASLPEFIKSFTSRKDPRS